MLANNSLDVLLQKIQYSFECERVLLSAVIKVDDIIHLFDTAIKKDDNSTIGYRFLSSFMVVAASNDTPFVFLHNPSMNARVRKIRELCRLMAFTIYPILLTSGSMLISGVHM